MALFEHDKEAYINEAGRIVDKADEYLGIVRVDPLVSMGASMILPLVTAMSSYACALYLRALVEDDPPKPDHSPFAVSPATLDLFKQILKEAETLVEEWIGTYGTGSMGEPEFHKVAMELVGNYGLDQNTAVNLIEATYMRIDVERVRGLLKK